MANTRKTSNLSDRFRELGLGTRRLSTDRFISKEGRFNVVKRGIGLNGFSFYHWLINMSWTRFFVFITLTYLLVNLLFASVYYLIGIEYLSEYDHNALNAFSHCFFFSAQTLTTVGYGRISPIGPVSSFIASIEAMIGLLAFAFATGVMYGRFSKARSKIIFSDNILVSPYKKMKGLKFRIANSRESQLIDMETRVMYSFLQKDGAEMKRRYMPLDLEINFINLFPLPWTIVHPIDANSPLFGKGMLELAEERAEFLIILKGFDDTFNSYVHQIHEYNNDEIVLDADFKPMFNPAEQGETTVYLNKINDIEKKESF